MMPVLKQKTPAQYGAPAKFISFRPRQFDAIRHGVESSVRFVVQAVPTGGGKSLNAIIQALATSSRAAYLTSTKGLQDQLLTDFESIGLTDVRGQSNYQCIEVHEKDPVHVDEGPCHFGYACNRVERVRKNGTVREIPPSIDPCLYFDAIKRAKTSQLVVTNYAYWMNSHKHSDGLGEFDLLILDEAHNVVDELSSFLSIEFTAWEIEALLESAILGTTDMREWRTWARIRVQQVAQRIAEIKSSISSGGQSAWSRTRKLARHLKRVHGKLKALSESSGEWVCEAFGKLIRFDIVWPQDYAESILFRDIPRVLLLSATVRPKTAKMLGIPDSELDFREYPHTFPKSNRPTYCVDTVRLSSKSTPADYTAWVRRMDQIISARQDRKGVIHTGSYARRNLLLEKSEFRRMMMTHDRKNTAEVVSNFQCRTVPVVLVSPSVTTGYDFPGPQCEYQIIGKVPFPDMRSSVMSARKKRDPEYDSYIAIQQIVQAAGRGVRSEEDRCEVFIIDNHFADWFIWRSKHLAPKWFLDSIEVCRTIPRPPRPMLRNNRTTKIEGD